MALDRKLAYRDRYVLKVGQVISGDIDPDNLATFPDQITPITLSVQWTQEEYTRILSALLTGADLVYPYQSHQIYHDFLRLVNGNMTCEQIIDCLENDADTKQALINFLSNSGIQPTSGNNPPVPMSTSQSADNLLPANYICDNNHLFGMARFIVQQLNASTQDLLEKIETLTNDVELVAVFADNVEGVSWFGSGVELVAWLQDQLIDWYDGAYTSSVEDELACEIFCLIKDDCNLTIDRILQAYAVNSFSTPTAPDSWIDILEWLVDTQFDGSIGTVATYHYFLVQALRYSSKIPIFDSFRGMEQIVSLGANETDANWVLLCTSCASGGWCYSLDLTQFTHFDFSGFSGTQNAGVLNGASWDSSETSGGNGIVQAIGVGFTFPSASISAIEMDFVAVQGSASGGIDYPVRPILRNGNSNVFDAYPSELPLFSETTYRWDFNGVNADNIRLYSVVDSRSSSGVTDGSSAISAVRLYGVGANPFGNDNC